MEKGKRKWVRIITVYMYMHTQLAIYYIYTCLNETKKGDETSKSKIPKRGNIAITNLHKKVQETREGFRMAGLYSG